MSLEDLNEKIHGREFEVKNPRADLPFTPTTPSKDSALPHALGQDVTDWTKYTPPKTDLPGASPDLVMTDPTIARRKKLALLFGSVSFLVLGVGIFLWTQVIPFSTDKVRVTIMGPKTAESNQNVNFKILYENENWKDMENAVLIVSHPSTFRLESGADWKASESRAEYSLGKISSGTKGTVELRGSFHAFQNQIGVFQVTLRYVPEGLSSRYDTSAESTVAIGSSTIVLDITAPLQVGSDQTMEYVINYTNESDDPLDNMRLKLEYPEGFRYASGDPKPTEGDTLWYIGNIPPGGSGKVRIQGSISGVKDDVKRMTARLGKVQGDGNFLSFGEMERVTRIVTSPISITQTVNGLVDGGATPGEELHYKVKFRNDGDLGLRNLVLTIDVDTTYLDMNKFRLRYGAYDAAKKQILMRASDVARLSQLAPGESGEVEFSVTVREDAAAVAMGKKDIVIETIAKMDSPDIPTPIGANKVIASNFSRVKIFSEVSAQVLGYYTDPVLPNTGPIPPQVGKETTYTLHVKLKSSLNDITTARLSLFFPANIRYIGPRPGETEVLRWNERTGELVWEAGTLSGGANEERVLLLQVGLTPDASLVNDDPRLLNRGVLTGREEFGDRDIRVDVPEKTTILLEDATIMEMSPLGYKVVP